MKKVNTAIAFLMVGVIIFLVVKRYVFDADKLNSDFKITVATVYRIYYPVDGGPDADFSFCVSQVIYKNSVSFNSNKEKITVGDKFLVRYYPADPNIASILLDQPIDSVSISKMGILECKNK